MKLTTPKEGVDSAWPLPLEMTQYVLAHLDIWSMGPPAQVCHFFQAAVANIRNGRQWPQHVIVSVLELEGAPFDYSEIAANLAGVEWGGQGNFYGEYWDKRQNFVAAREDVKRRRESATPSQLAVMEAAMKRFVGLGVLVAGGGLVLWKFDAFSNEDPGPVEHC